MINERTLTTKDLALIFRMSRRALVHRLMRGTLPIPGKKIGREWRFKQSDVEAFLAAWPTREPARE